MIKAVGLLLVWYLIAFALAKAPGHTEPAGGFELVGLLHDDRALNRPHDVELQGDIAYVPGKGGTLAIIDVGDPTAPRLLSALVDAQGLEDAETVLPMGDTLLLGTCDLVSIDVSDPSRPVVLKKISDRPRIDRINGMAMRGKYVFAANKSGYVDVFDVSDPRDPKLFDVLDTQERGGLISPHDIAAFGDRIIVPESSDDGPAKVRVYRVAEPGSDVPLPVAEWELEGAVEGRNRQNFGGANRIVLSGSHAYVGCFRLDLVAVLDISDPTRLVQVAFVPVGDRGATGMTISGDALFVAGGECVDAFDVSNPSRPTLLARYRGGDLFPTTLKFLDGRARRDNGHDLVYRDGYLYVTAQNDSNLGILKVTDPEVLRLAE